VVSWLYFLYQNSELKWRAVIWFRTNISASPLSVLLLHFQTITNSMVYVWCYKRIFKFRNLLMIQFLPFQPSNLRKLTFWCLIICLRHEIRFGEVARLIRTWFTAKVAPLYFCWLKKIQNSFKLNHDESEFKCNSINNFCQTECQLSNPINIVLNISIYFRFPKKTLKNLEKN